MFDQILFCIFRTPEINRGQETSLTPFMCEKQIIWDEKYTLKRQTSLYWIIFQFSAFWFAFTRKSSLCPVQTPDITCSVALEMFSRYVLFLSHKVHHSWQIQNLSKLILYPVHPDIFSTQVLQSSSISLIITILSSDFVMAPCVRQDWSIDAPFAHHFFWWDLSESVTKCAQASMCHHHRLMKAHLSFSCLLVPGDKWSVFWNVTCCVNISVLANSKDVKSQPRFQWGWDIV